MSSQILGVCRINKAHQPDYSSLKFKKWFVAIFNSHGSVL
jgi:hypothetical protein